jgi:hypothetical protein
MIPTSVSKNPPLYFVPLEDGFTFSLSNDLEYKVNNSSWVKLNAGTTSPQMNALDKIYIAGNISHNDSGVGTFNCSKRFEAGGSPLSLIYGRSWKSNWEKNNKTIPRYAFSHLFHNTPIVSAEDMCFLDSKAYNNCFEYMFADCTNLTTAPDLSTINLAPFETSQAQYMFANCTNLTTPPGLPQNATQSSYYGMFYECTSLQYAPELPKAKGSSCFCDMFALCANLRVPPSTIEGSPNTYSFHSMFRGCESLKTTPTMRTIGTTNGSLNSHDWMFINCSSLNYIRLINKPNTNFVVTQDWVKNVSDTGLFVKGYDFDIDTGPSGIPENWRVVTLEETPLHFIALNDGLKIKFTKDVYYSVDDFITWTPLAANTYTPSISKMERIYFKAANDFTWNESVGTFSCDRDCEVAGNILSLVYVDDFISKIPSPEANYLFSNVFQNNAHILHARDLKLPTETGRYWYQYMFDNCANLITPPPLTAPVAYNSCYYGMFQNCSSLVKAPILYAIEVDTYSYFYMFNGCTNLNSVEIHAEELASYGDSAEHVFKGWLKNTSSKGTIKMKSNLDISFNTYSGVPEGWTVNYI